MIFVIVKDRIIKQSKCTFLCKNVDKPWNQITSWIDIVVKEVLVEYRFCRLQTKET